MRLPLLSIALIVAVTPGAAQSCGGLAGVGCGPGLYCDYPVETLCGAADRTGSCVAPPEACTMEYDPVCGCDGQTYSNACMASAASASVAARGPCRAADDAPSCEFGLQVLVCAEKDGVMRTYSDPCAAERDGATGIVPRTDAGCGTPRHE